MHLLLATDFPIETKTHMLDWMRTEWEQTLPAKGCETNNQLNFLRHIILTPQLEEGCLFYLETRKKLK